MTGPVSKASRIAVVDVLRAFALFGIILSHAKTGFHAGPPPGPDFMQFSALDTSVSKSVTLLATGKFFAIFSFLFGLSFAIQLGNAAQKETAFAGRFAWRLGVLFLIGMAHQLIFNGDILVIYAVLGLLLIPFGKVPTRVLLVLGLVLLMNVPGLIRSGMRANGPPPSAAQLAAATQARQQFMAGARRQYEINKSGSVADLAKINFSYGLPMKWRFQIATGRAWITFGCFLLGVCAWRANVFRDSEASRKFFKHVLVWGGGVALVSSVLTLAYPPPPPMAGPPSLWMQLMISVQNVSLAATYVAIVTLLYWKRDLLTQLAPLGKMGLTTYLLQSVFGVVLFFGVGFGLLGEIGTAAAVAAGAAFFVVQIWFARWWLTRFSMGPVEWLWRSLTYFKLQPNGRAVNIPVG